MKNLIIYSGLALVVLTSIDYKSINFIGGVEASQDSKKEIVASKAAKVISSTREISNLKKEIKISGFKTKTLCLRNLQNGEANNTNDVLEPIVLVSSQKSAKTANQLIAEDNAITGNNISNETLSLDFDLIKSILEGYELVEPINSAKKEKTADQLIAEDNAITGNSISNEMLTLDFDTINSISEVPEEVEPVNIPKKEKTPDQLIAEDNSITGNCTSNETLILDFDVINSLSEGYVFVEPVNIPKKEKTADELIAEDNAITGNNISNETQALDFEIINKFYKI